MAPMKQQNNNYSSNHGEAVVRQANVLASCYLVDAATTLKGLHYCTTGGPSGIPEVPTSGLPSPPSSPPLAAITSSNELALLPKSNKRREVPGKRMTRRGGAALSIREECERFFCEIMTAVFHGEMDTGSNGSGLRGVNLQTPPPEDEEIMAHRLGFAGGNMLVPAGAEVSAWLEIWDYAGGASFRAFIAEEGTEKSLFAFFDAGIVGRDLKQALMALIELADTPLGCQHLVICIDRQMEEEEAKALMKSLQWVGFELTALDHWAHDLDVTSRNWLFMGMEI